MQLIVREINNSDRERISALLANPALPKGLYSLVPCNWPTGWHNGNICIDQESGDFLTQVPDHPTSESAVMHLLCFHDQPIVLQQKGYALYSFYFISPSHLADLDKIRIFASKALEACGDWRLIDIINPKFVDPPEAANA